MGFKMNYCAAIGRVGKDAEVVTFQNGGKVVKLNVGITESYKNAQGEWVDNTHWMRCTYSSKSDAAIDRVAGIKKGDEVFIEGSLNVSSYEKDGVKNTITEIRISNVQINRKVDASTASPSAPAPAPKPSPAPSAPAADDDDEMPF
jgi:single-strand DNA-binding protein